MSTECILLAYSPTTIKVKFQYYLCIWQELWLLHMMVSTIKEESLLLLTQTLLRLIMTHAGKLPVTPWETLFRSQTTEWLQEWRSVTTSQEVCPFLLSMVKLNIDVRTPFINSKPCMEFKLWILKVNTLISMKRPAQMSRLTTNGQTTTTFTQSSQLLGLKRWEMASMYSLLERILL